MKRILAGVIVLATAPLVATSCAVVEPTEETEESDEDFGEAQDPVCTPGSYTIANCTKQTSTDATWSSWHNPAPSWTVSSSSYGGTSCPGRFVVEPNYPGPVWDYITAYVPSGSAPTNACDCEKLQISLEVEETTCVNAGYCSGTCIETGGSCGPSDPCPNDGPCHINYCNEEWLCLSSHIVRETAAGTWNPLLGTCRTVLQINRTDPPGGFTFQGVDPQARAAAINTVTGAKYPISVRMYD